MGLLNMDDKLKEFFSIRPGMREKFEYPGTFDNLAADIANAASGVETNGLLQEIIMEKAGRILAGEVSLPALKRQLSAFPVMSTADHHALLNYKLLYNSNILYGEIVKKLKLPFIVASATGNIPLVNKTYPRGFYFKGQKFNFFTERKSKVPVFLFHQKLSVDRSQGIKSFILNYSRELITVEEEAFLEYLFFEALEIEKAARNYEKFSDQITFLNYKLWKYYFDKSLRDSVPEMIYFQINYIVQHALIREIEKKDSLISHILFDPGIRKVFLRNFAGISGAWDETKGTELFWGISEKRRPVPLKIDNHSNSLVGGNFSVEIERESLIHALETKTIISSLFLDFLIITFMEGYVAVGGFNQLEYLPQMQRAHIKSLRETGMNDLAERFDSRVTDTFICGMFPFDFDSGIDLIWDYNSHDGKFNGNLDGGLTQGDLDKMLNRNVKDMIGAAVEVMLKNT